MKVYVLLLFTRGLQLGLGIVTTTAAPAVNQLF